MRSTLARSARRVLASLLTGCLLAAADSSVAASAQSVAPTADTVRSHILKASTGLLDSAPGSTPSLVTARAHGHLARLSGEIDAAGLRSQPSARARLAWLEAAMTGRGLEAGAETEIARTATREALILLAEAAPNDPAIHLDQLISTIEAGKGDSIDLGDLRAADLGHRPFVTSPDAICDRLARSRGVPAALAMLDLADAGALPEVVASVLAADLDANEAIATRLDALDHSAIGIGPTVIAELAQRKAGAAVFRYVRAHPESVALAGTRTAAIAAVAAVDPDNAIVLAGGPEVLGRIPGAGRVAVETAMARGLAATDPDAAWDHANEAGQLDDRIVALLAIRIPSQDPDRTLEEMKSLRTVAPGRLVADLLQHRLEREATTEGLADLFRTGRYDLAYSLLIPNTTELTRPADQWLPTRIALLADALARANAAPDAFIPLLESISRIHGVDGQIESFAAIAAALTALDVNADLPEPLRAVLNDVLVAIALRG